MPSMRRPQRALRATLAVTLALVTATACGGDDLYPRDEFVEQTTANGVTRSVAECTYDQIKGNKAIMAELNRTGGPNPDISQKVDSQLSKILARCILAENEDPPSSTTTTTGKRSTTTTSEKRSTTTTRRTTTTERE